MAVGLNDTASSLLQSIEENAEEVSPSTLFAVASILEGVRGRKGGRVGWWEGGKK